MCFKVRKCVQSITSCFIYLFILKGLANLTPMIYLQLPGFTRKRKFPLKKKQLSELYLLSILFV